MRNRFTCCNGRDMTSRCAASFQKLKFNTKHIINSTFLQSCSFKFVILIQIRGHAVTYQSAVGHTVSRDVNSQARVHQVWALERSEMQNFSHGFAFPVWRIRMCINGSQWNEKCSVTAPLGMHRMFGNRNCSAENRKKNSFGVRPNKRKDRINCTEQCRDAIK